MNAPVIAFFLEKRKCLQCCDEINCSNSDGHWSVCVADVRTTFPDYSQRHERLEACLECGWFWATEATYQATIARLTALWLEHGGSG